MTYLEQRRAFIEAGRPPKEKKIYKIPPISKKKAALMEAEKGLTSVGGGNELDRWFNERRKEMNGSCGHCGGKSCKDSDQYFKFSICHILPKAYFPSVATNLNNWLELCFWNQSCHTLMDNKILDLTEMACWDEIVTKFVAMYPDIAQSEKRRIPSVLLEYVKTEL